MPVRANSSNSGLSNFLTVAIILAAAGGGIVIACPPESKDMKLTTPAAPQLEARADRAIQGETILEVAADAGSFTTLAKAIDAAGLTATLNGPGPFTVFAPTDEAFATLPRKTLESLLKPENKKKLAAILTYHVVAGRVEAAQALKLPGAITINGQRAPLVVRDGRLTIAGANIIKTDINASNGVIHVIDRVILPADETIVETAVKAKFATLVTAAKAAGLADFLGGPQQLTVFAPTDEAFAKLPKDVLSALLKPENKDILAVILKYHVVAGRVYADQAATLTSATTLQGGSVKLGLRDGRLQVDGATIIKTDIDASNGVVHVIDTVLTPAGLDLSKLVRASTSDRMPGDAMSPQGLIDTAIAKGVPLFNSGNQEGCAAVYEVTMAALMSMDAVKVPGEVKNTLQLAMERGRKQHDMTERAWTYRKALDGASEMMASGR